MIATVVMSVVAFILGMAFWACMSLHCDLQFCVAFPLSLLALTLMTAIVADFLKTEIEKKCDVIAKAIEKCAEMEEKEAENRANKEAAEERRVHELLLKFMECQLQKEDLHVHLPE